MPLPAEVPTGLVVGVFNRAIGDTVDAGIEPDSEALSGQVTFTPNLTGGRLKVADSTPPQTVIVRPVPVTLAAGALSVRLVAGGDLWTWTATFALTGVYIAPITFAVPAGGTVDLTVVAPAETANGGELYIAQAVASAASAAASAASSQASADSSAASAALVGAPADVAVAAIVGNPASATRGALSSTYVRPGSVGERLRKAAATSVGRSLDVATTPPILTGSATTLDATLTKAYRSSVVGYAPYRITGGTAQQGTAGYAPYVIAPVVTRPGGGGDTPGKPTHNTYGWAVEFLTDAPKVMLRWGGSSVSYQIEVDDRPISATGLPYTVGNGGTEYAMLDFSGVVKVRKIRVELQHNVIFDGVYVGPAYTIWKPISDTFIRATLVGDSIGAGTGTIDANGQWFVVAGKLLGWTDARSCSLGETGFVNAGVDNTFGSALRVADVVATNPDLLVIATSGNDDGLGGIQAAALAAFQAYRVALPLVPVVVLGAFGASTGPSAGRLATDAAVLAAFTQWDDDNSWWVPNCTDPAGSWDTGTGNAGSRTVADGATTNANSNITSATANFTTVDVLSTLTGTNIPAGSYIVSRTSATQVVLNNAATATATGSSFTITNQKRDGNRDRLGQDTGHPNNAGHIFEGTRFANAIRNTVLNAIL